MIAKTLRLLLVLGLLALIGWILYTSRTILLYIVIAGVVTLIGRPIFNLLGKPHYKERYLSNSLKAGITLITVLLVVGGMLGYFLPAIFLEAQLLANIDVEEVKQGLSPILEWINRILIRLNISNGDEVTDVEVVEYLFDSIDLDVIPSIINSIAGILGNLLIAFFSVAFISFFLLRDHQLLFRWVEDTLPSRLAHNLRKIRLGTQKTLSRYFLGLIIQVIAITLCIFIGLSILGIKNALLIASFTGIVNLVPYLGPWIGASFGTFILVANNLEGGFGVIEPKLWGLLIVFAITQLIDNYVFQPLIFSNSINAHPLEIFLVILIAGSIGGVGGMIAAIPTYSFLRIVLVQMNLEFKWTDKLRPEKDQPV
jgi:predicted PurR-regulated permease PerM